MGVFFFICIYDNFKLKIMLQVKLTPQEIQLTIAAINNIQLLGKDAHMVSGLLKKFENKLEGFKPVQKG